MTLCPSEVGGGSGRGGDAIVDQDLDAGVARAGFFRLPPHHRQQLVVGVSVGFLEITERRGVREAADRLPAVFRGRDLELAVTSLVTLYVYSGNTAKFANRMRVASGGEDGPPGP